MGTRSTAVQLGLSRIEAGNGTLISFSTQPGAVALDGTGRNSPFAEALVRQLDSSNLSIADMLIDVRREVRLATKDRQITWEHSSLSERFYFTPPKPVAPPPLPPPAAKPEVEKEPAELTPAQKSALTRRLNRELRRVGCDPRATGGTWTNTSQAALQRFAEIMKLAIHTDEPTQAALDALTTQVLVCPRPVAAPEPPNTGKSPATPVVAAPPPANSSKTAPQSVPRAAVVKTPPAVAQPPFATKVQRQKKCRPETMEECRVRMGMQIVNGFVCPVAARIEICQCHVGH